MRKGERKLGHGVFGWCTTERRSNRYGSIHLASNPYGGEPLADLKINRRALKQLSGKRVRLFCRVVETRRSGHIGDVFLGIVPTTPRVDDEVTLGVGRLATSAGYDGLPDIALEPEDGRMEFWIDPRLLYRLHDQTVDVFAALTDEPCHPAPDLAHSTEAEVFGNEDGSFQVKNVDGPFVVPPTVIAMKRVGDSVFFDVETGVGPGVRKKVDVI